MKKLALFSLAFVLLLGVFVFFYRPPIFSGLPYYKSCEFYTSGGFQDFTDYEKYTFKSVTAENFKNSKYFTETTSDDVEEILLYIDDFEGWVAACGGELEENYDFDKSMVSEGDFFYIETKEGQPIGQGTYKKFDNYSVWYFDIGSQTLYYLHNNI